MARRMNPWVGWILALSVAAGFLSLGFWQLGRAQQKEAMLAEVSRVLAERHRFPLVLASDASRAHSYDWAAGEGSFVDAPAVLLDNQQREGHAGVRVYRLFEFKPFTAPPVLVDLGWLPLPGDRTLPAIERLPDLIDVEGLLVPPPSHGIVAATLTRQVNGGLLVTGLDADGLASALGVGSLPPRVLKLDPALKLGYARDLNVLPNTMPPERHIAYAVQWFGLALAVLATAAILTFRRRRAGHAKMPA